ncbi:MAG: hypothetical protein LBG12_00050 [Synergistaceae bacterium]|jgi:hypothetical protein|nr:hypothetical protein [Synergistaceae bacterium]
MRGKTKTQESKKLHRITVRFDDEEYANINSEAKSVGITVSKYVREKVKRGCVRVNPYAKIDAAGVNQLSKLGGLLKTVHIESGKAYSAKTAAILDDIQAVILKFGGASENDRQTHTESQRA